MSSPECPQPPPPQAAFVRLLLKHEPALRAYARVLLPDWQSVDEAIQEASVTLWEKFGQLQDESGFLPWAKATVRFKCLTLVDRLRRDRHILSGEVLELLANEAESATSEDADDSLRALRSCLEEFSTDHRELLLAPYAGDGGVATLALVSGKSPNAFYKRLGRLREKLSACVAKRLRQNEN